MKKDYCEINYHKLTDEGKRIYENCEKMLKFDNVNVIRLKKEQFNKLKDGIIGGKESKSEQIYFFNKKIILLI